MRISLQLLVPLASILLSFFVKTCDAVAFDGADATFSFFNCCFCCNFASAFSNFFVSTFYTKQCRLYLKDELDQFAGY